MLKRGKTLNSQSRELVVKLYNYFERESVSYGPLLPLIQPRERVAEALGIGKRTVTQILKEKYGPSGSEDNTLRTPKRRKRDEKIVGVDHFDAAAIRNHIYGYYSRKEYPTREKLMSSLKDACLFYGGKSSLSKVLKSIGFRFKKSDKRKILLERYDIILKRVTFLRQVNKITDWDNVMFIDETWLNANHTVSRTWTDDTAASTSKVPSGKGARLIICHAGSASQGFIPDCLLAFASKTTSDYHEEMNAEGFKEWFEKLLVSLENPSKIIMDNAPYHSVLVDKPPTQANKKQEIVSWLISTERLSRSSSEYKTCISKSVCDEDEVLLLWLCKLEDEEKVYCITLLGEDKKRGYCYIGGAVHIRDKQDPSSLYDRSECLIVKGSAVSSLYDIQNQITVIVSIIR